MNKIVFFTDGGCFKNPGFGSYSFVGVSGKKVFERSVYVDEETTNNRMEMEAIVDALKFALKNGYEEVHIYSDSEYCVNGITKWIHTWLKKAKKMANMDLWNQMYAFCCAMNNVTFHAVRGHSGVYGNEMADKLCSRSIARHIGSSLDRELRNGEDFSCRPVFSAGFFQWKRGLKVESKRLVQVVQPKDPVIVECQEKGLAKKWLEERGQNLK
jgi:ribonuclease HI